MAIPPFQQVMELVRGKAAYVLTNSVLEATPSFKRQDPLLVSSVLVIMTEGKTMLQITNPHNHTYTLDSSVAVANFKVMAPQQAANTNKVAHAHVLLMNNHPEECDYI